MTDETNETRMIKLDYVYFDTTTQPRILIDMSTIEDYAAAMQAGDEFPPIEVVADVDNPKRFWPWDGYHRVWAARMIGRKEILARVIDGTLRDAQWLSASANQQHTALRRTNADKRRAVQIALAARGELSNAEIARHCGVSHTFVNKLRETASCNGFKIDTPSARTVKRGDQTYQMDVSKIGKPAEVEPTPPATTPGIAEEADRIAAAAQAAGVVPAQYQQPGAPEPASHLPLATAQFALSHSQKRGRLCDLVCGDMLDIANTMEPGSIGTVITMPPIRYSPLGPDKKFECFDLFGPVARVAARLLRPKGTAIVLVPPRELPYALNEMMPHLTYRWTGAYLVPGGYGEPYPGRRVTTYWMAAIIMFNYGPDEDCDVVGCDDIIIQDLNKEAINLDSEERIGWGYSLPGLAGILAWTNPQHLVLDPCCGNSRIGETAIRMGRDFIGFEADPQRAAEVKQRLAVLADGE